MRKRVMDGPPATTKLPHGAVTHREDERVGERERGSERGRESGRESGRETDNSVLPRWSRIPGHPGQTGPQLAFWQPRAPQRRCPPQGRSERDTVPMKWGYVGGKIQHQTAGRRFQGCPVLACQEYQRSSIVNHSFQLISVICWLSSLSLHGMSSAASGGPYVEPRRVAYLQSRNASERCPRSTH